MSNFAPPISRPPFLYQGEIYVEVGNLNRHPRASVAELTALLRPTKATLASEDKVGHYYEAQLIHYGLAASKNKAVAKVRLLEALNKGDLKLPNSIAQVEKQLKKEYDAENRKAKAAYKAQQDGGSSLPVVENKKRKTAVDAGPSQPVKKTKVDVPAVPKEKPAKKAPAPKKATPAQEKKPASAKKSQALTEASASNALVAQDNTSINLSHYSMSELEDMLACGQIKILGNPGVGPKSGVARTEKEATEPTKKKTPMKKDAVPKEPNAKKEPAPKKESAPKKEPATKKEPAVKKQPASKNPPAPKSEPSIKPEPTPPAPPAPVPRQRQTARRSRPFTPRGGPTREDFRARTHAQASHFEDSSVPPDHEPYYPGDTSFDDYDVREDSYPIGGYADSEGRVVEYDLYDRNAWTGGPGGEFY